MKKIFFGLFFVTFCGLFVQLDTEAQKFNQKVSSVVRLDVYEEAGGVFGGSGFFISSDSLILTNAHVIIDQSTGNPAQVIDICLIENEYLDPQCEYAGEVIAFDEAVDLALIAPSYKIDGEGNIEGDYIGLREMGFDFVDFADLKPSLGADLTILGFPEASTVATITLTRGIASGFTLFDTDKIWEVLTDAVINPGNSGGPAFNDEGRVVGVVTEISTNGIGGNYGYLRANDIIKMWFEELVAQEILSPEYVNTIFKNDRFGTKASAANYQGPVEFDDLDQNHPYYVAVSYLQSLGIISGYEDGNFRPDSEINRAEFLKLLVEMRAGNKDFVGKNNCFPDVRDEWFSAYVCYAKANNWVVGYADGNFHPEKNVTKSEAIKMMLEVLEIPLLKISFSDAPAFNDVPHISWYGRYIFTAKAIGILEEETGDYFPERHITRGQVSENLFRYLVGPEGF